MSIYKGDGKKYPVILIVDNDKGAKDIKSIIKEKLKISKISTKKSYNLTENLSVIFATEKDESEIEDLFDNKTLKTKIDGKSFNKSKGMDTNTEYGKYIFAEKVIKANKRNIDFSGFKPLLDKISFVIENYSNNH